MIHNEDGGVCHVCNNDPCELIAPKQLAQYLKDNRWKPYEVIRILTAIDRSEKVIEIVHCTECEQYVVPGQEYFGDGEIYCEKCFEASPYFDYTGNPKT